MDKDKMLEYRNLINSYKKTGQIKECFCHRNDECKGKIKQSHSLQRNGRLSIIEGDVNGNQSIYTFLSNVPSEEHIIEDLKPIGKKEASTFYGFCDHHDTVLFSPIENNAFDDSDEHCFLHSYRSYAHSYHKKKEQYQAVRDVDSEYVKKLPVDIIKTMQQGTEMAMNDSENYKKLLDKYLDNKAYNELEYLTYVKPGLFPFAVSSQLSPNFTYSGKEMNNHTDPNIPFSQPMITFLPDKEQTIVILAAFKNDPNSILLLDELDNLPDLKLEKAITSLIIANCENTFFAPAVWQALTKASKRRLLDEFSNTSMSGMMTNPPRGFFHSSFNFFDPCFESKQLKIEA